MGKLTFESLLPRAQKLFYKAWIDEAKPAEIEWNRQYFEKYPNKGNFQEFYNKCLKKHAHVLQTDWQYEDPEKFDTPEEFLKYIEEEEAYLKELYA